MGWREDARPATFRGVSFFVSRAPTEQRLHADEHIFPGRDNAASSISVRHLGVGPQRFTIDAFVFGDDYRDRRDALEDALREQRPGRLVHPFRGEHTVSIVGSIQTAEATKEGGYASIRFVAVPVADTGLRSRVDTGELAERDLDAFLAAQAADFDTSYITEGVPAVYQESARGFFDSASEALRTAHSAISQGLGVVDEYASRVGDFADVIADFASLPAAAVGAFADAAETIAALPGEVGRSLTRGLDSLISIGDEVLRGFDALTSFGAGAPYIPTSTTNGAAEARLRSAVIRTVRVVGVASAARAALVIPYAARAEALGMRDALVDAFGSIAADAEGAGGTSVSGAAVYDALVAARIAVSRHLEAAAAELPEVRSYVVPVEQPALVIAWRELGDARRVTEIEARNRLPHPGDVARGAVLELLR